MAKNSVSTGTAMGKVGVMAGGALRVNMAIPHLLGAARFSRQLKAIQVMHAGKPWGEHWEEARDHAVACLFLTCACFEAYTNELYSDRSQLFEGPAQIAQVEQSWKKIERQSTLEKFEFFAKIKGKTVDTGTPVYDSMKSIVALRNALMHFKPEFTNEATRHKEVSDELSAFLSKSGQTGDELLFPREWVSHESAEKIVKACEAFLKHFERNCGFPGRTNWSDYQGRLEA